MRLKFRSKLTIFIGLILVAIQAASFLSVYTSARNVALEQGREELEFARTVLTRQLDNLTTDLAERARVVTFDFGFRENIALGDVATQRSVIENLRDRVGADRVMLISLDHDIVADTAADQGTAFAFPKLIETAEDDGQAAAIMPIGATLYRSVIVPVLAPEPIAWIGIGLEINDKLTQRLRRQGPVPLDVSFAFLDDGQWQIAASTLDMTGRDNLMTYARDVLGRADEPELVDIGGETFIVLRSPIKDAVTKTKISVLLQYSVQKIISRSYPLLISMVIMLIGGLGIALAGGVMMARGVSRPLNDLVEAAGRVSDGNYHQPIDLKGDDEFGALSTTFNEMMTGIREREERISYQARFDSLTGLPNRSEFVKRLTAVLDTCADKGSVAVAVLALERLPETNSTLGYQVGDGLIREIANRLSGIIADENIASRLDSDKFALVFKDYQAEVGEEKLSALATAFEQPILIDDLLLAIDLTYGLACAASADGDAERVIRQAETAMHKAQQSGQDFKIFDPEVDEVNPDRLLLIADMRRAIMASEFELFYQPKIDFRSETVFAAEALIRWQHLERGMISPGMFIPLAEQTGDVRLITEWTLSRAVRDAKTLAESGRDIKIAINLSTLDLGYRQLPAQIETAVQGVGLAPEALILEITESGLMSEPALARQLLDELSEMGFILSIDDYGTGYSSLAYLKNLPVAELKIDQAFIRNLATNPEDEVICRSTVDLGHNLGLKVTAEGIEDAESFKMLQAMSCDVGQGYYMAKPMPYAEFIQFLEESRWGDGSCAATGAG